MSRCCRKAKEIPKAGGSLPTTLGMGALSTTGGAVRRLTR